MNSLFLSKMWGNAMIFWKCIMIFSWMFSLSLLAMQFLFGFIYRRQRYVYFNWMSIRSQFISFTCSPTTIFWFLWLHPFHHWSFSLPLINPSLFCMFLCIELDIKFMKLLPIHYNAHFILYFSTTQRWSSILQHTFQSTRCPFALHTTNRLQL